MAWPSHRRPGALASIVSSWRWLGRLDLLVNGLLIGLLALSWLTSLIGMSQLSADDHGQVDLGPGLLIVFGSLLVVLLMWVMLERARLPGPPVARAAAFGCYLVLAAWVAGFGYSFWWSAIAAQPDTSRTLSAALNQADAGLAAVRGRYAAVADRLTRVGKLAQSLPAPSARKACALTSPTASERLAAERNQLAAAARGQAMAINGGMLPRLDAALGDLRGMVRGADSTGAAGSAVALQGLYERAERLTRDTRARLEGDSRGAAADLRLAVAPALGPAGGDCVNGALTRALLDAASDIERPSAIVLPDWRLLEGRAATEAALSRLWSGAIRSLPGAHAAATPAPGFTARDWIALVAALAVDLGVLALTLMRPRPGGQTFMGHLRVGPSVRADISAAVARHSQSAFQILYDHHFSYGRHDVLVIPDAASKDLGGAKAHQLHLAMASLSRVLGARRIMRPSVGLLSAAIERLEGLGWAPQPAESRAGRVADGSKAGGVSTWAWISGRLRPGHPHLYAITAADRDEAIRLLDDVRADPAPWSDHAPPPGAATDPSSQPIPGSPWPSAPSVRYGHVPGFTLDKGLAMVSDDISWTTGVSPPRAAPAALALESGFDASTARAIPPWRLGADEAAGRDEAHDWSARNQTYLSAMIAAVRTDLERRANRAPEAERAANERPPSSATGAPPYALERLRRAFHLSAFEQDLLVLCAGLELESDFADLCAAAHGDPRRAYPTFGLALAALPDAHWSALSPDAALRQWRLIEIDPSERLAVSPLRIDERILHYLIGVDSAERRLRGMIEPVADRTALPPSYVALADKAAHALALAKGESGSPVVHLAGADGASQRSIAAILCHRLGLALSAAPLDALPRGPGDLEDALRLWRREAILDGRGLFIEAQDAEGADAIVDLTIARIVQGAEGVVIVGGRPSIRGGTRPVLRLDIPPLSNGERRALWSTALTPSSVRFEALPEALTNPLLAQFRLSPAGIEAAAAQALAAIAAQGGMNEQQAPAIGQALWSACRIQARAGLDRIAQRIEPTVDWSDLILPEAQRAMLREITNHLRHGVEVYDDWGFGSKSARGLGVNALFAGPSGTGKTTAAEVLARDLDLDLYRIDLSQVVNKYIGETEKNLARVFDAAEASGAILLFDEADALFGKRSEVKDSHDRYANLEVSYLLQRMESYRGLAILTTNMKGALDHAFLRRLRFLVQFPFPDQAQREEIWRTAFPSGTPTDGLDLAKLARLNVAGGQVRNIALGAAFLAAGDGQPVRMEHILRATRGECAKLDRPIAEAEIRGWV